jgi:hypothetical protein
MTHLLHKLFGWINKNGLLTFAIMVIISTTLSTFGFLADSEEHNFELVMIAQGLIQSFADLPSDTNFFLVLGKISWMLTFALAAVSMFLQEWSYKQLVASLKQRKHRAIIGVGKSSHAYIEELNKNETVIYNINDGIYAAALKESGFAVENVEIINVLSHLHLQNITHMVINVGTDKENINTAFEVIEAYMNRAYKHSLRLIVRIENKEFNALFRSNSVFSDEKYKSGQIELYTYSFYEECAVSLFRENFIDGEDNAIIDSYEEYAIVIAGDGRLANNIVYEAAKTAHLPNQNKLHIYLVSNEAERFKKSLIKSYPGIGEIPTLELHTRVLDYATLEYFTDTVWHTKNLTNAIICHDDENVNLEISASLQDKTYLKIEETKTKVLFGVFNQVGISNIIGKDQLHYKNFKPFGDANKILTKENIFDDTSNLLARMINYAYDGLTDNGAYSSTKMLHTQLDAIESNWFKNANLTDKLSSLAQAKHMGMKLKALGLRAAVSSKDKAELLQINRKLLDSKFDIDYKGNYAFPQSFDSTLFDRMIRMEHNRWNAFHYLNGWEYKPYFNEPKESKNRMKAIKLHNCLLPIEEFKNTYFVKEQERHASELVKLIEWDIYAFMYIPNYLAAAGYEIVKLESSI